MSHVTPRTWRRKLQAHWRLVSMTAALAIAIAATAIPSVEPVGQAALDALATEVHSEAWLDGDTLMELTDIAEFADMVAATEAAYAD